MARLLVLLAVLSGVVAALASGPRRPSELKDLARQYSVNGGRIVARDRSSGRIVWQRAAPALPFRWLGQASDVLVGVGTAPESVSGGRVGGDAFQPVDTVYGLNASNGKLDWRHPLDARLQDISRVVGNLVILTTADPAYAMGDTDVLHVRTGRVVLSTRRDWVYQDQTQVVFGCAFAPVPYCSGPGGVMLDRITVPAMRAEHWDLAVPTFEHCSYGDGAADHRSRYTAEYADYLVEDSCGWVFLRYTWAGGPKQKPLVRRVAAPEWPKGL